MDAATIGWIGAIAGSLIGIAGGVFGTYRSIISTETPEARKAVVRLSVYVWGFLAVFLGLLYALPSPYGFFAWIPFGIAMTLVSRHSNLERETSGTGPNSDA